jgi:uncharacterized protein
MPNRLAESTSPYLLQHQNNPVDWYPWGDEAFEKAKTEDKPVFLSVGYSSCHWCHVMEHESFEDEEVARILNERFVSVKVDREERPDVDEAYMTAVQLSSGRGGWPMSVFMTPDKKPFFAGTYFPKTDRGKYPGFITVITQIAEGWRSKRTDFLQAADEFEKALQETMQRQPPQTFSQLNWSLIDEAVQALAGDFDREHGGFGQAPKFPPHTAIDFLLAYATLPEAEERLRGAALSMVYATLQHMALGGVHDHVGGGFHRYSTDQRWLLPHFEKMLYDNALMLANYSFAARLIMNHDPGLGAFLARIAAGIVAWLDREMTAPEGYFYSALDADTEGEEGKFYVWTEDEVREVLGERAAAFTQTYGFAEGGNFEEEATGHKTGANIPHLQTDDGGAHAEDLAALLEARNRRTRPGLDDKGLTAWNGLMIRALAEAGELERAERAAKAILKAEIDHGVLPHQIAKGQPSGEAFLDGYAAFTLGLLALAEVEEEGSPGQEEWLREASRLAQEMIEKFYDGERHGFFFSSENHEMLFGRNKPVFDHPIPSANAMAVRCLLRFSAFEPAEQSLQSFIGWMERAPQATEGLLLATLELFMGKGEARPAPDEEPTVAAPAGEVSVNLERREIQVDAEGKGEAVVVIEIPPGLHLNSSAPPARWLTPTRLEVQPLRAVVGYPEGTDDRYEGTLQIPVTLELPAGESGAEFEIKVSYQACTETECQAPAEKTLSGVLYR